MAYASASNVAALCRNLLGDNTDFSTSTSPNLVSVNSWLSTGCSIIETRLTSIGIAAPVTGDTTVYQWVSYLNTLYAAAQAERSRINTIISPGERTRDMVLERDFWAGLDRLSEMDLDGAGLTKSYKAVYIGGISIADKESREDNSDRVVPRFYRNRF